MKVLYIDSMCKSGSTGKIVYRLYTDLRARGDEAAVCYGRGGLVEEENILRFAYPWETAAHAALTRLTGYTGCFSPLSTRRLLRFMDEFKPDIVHLHEPHAYFVNIKPLFEHIKCRNIPLVYTQHCEFAYTGKCGYAYDCDRWRTGCTGRCPQLQEYPKTLFFDHTEKMCAEKRRVLTGQNMIICTPSEWLARRAKESFLVQYDVRVIPNGIDTDVFSPQEYEHLKRRHGLTDEKIILAVAPGIMTDARKGGHEVLRLAEKMRGENAKFILIGDRTDEPTPDNVIILDRTENQQELAAYYSMADVFVICSSMENLPTTCLEAVCCGTPVAGYDVGGTAETAPAPVGRFAPYGDVDALRENVMALLNNPPASCAFDALRQRYSGENMFRQYAAIYDEMLSKKGDKSK